MQIIGCGNLDRGDDAAGLLALERLRLSCPPSPYTKMVICSGETTELLNLWEADDEVIIVDAVVTGAPAGTVHCWRNGVPENVRSSPASTHGFGIDEAIRLARALGRLPRAILIYGIEGSQFEIGSRPSVEVQRGVEKAVQLVRAKAGIAAASSGRGH